MKNPKSCRPATFRRDHVQRPTRLAHALPDASIDTRPGLLSGDCFAYACARHFAHNPMFKGTYFPDTELRPPERPPEGEGAALSGQGQGACWAFRSISQPAEAHSGLLDAENR